MVEIREHQDAIEVVSTGYREAFASRFRAIMAAHAVALAEYSITGKEVRVAVPDGWGEQYVIGPEALRF